MSPNPNPDPDLGGVVERGGGEASRYGALPVPRFAPFARGGPARLGARRLRARPALEQRRAPAEVRLTHHEQPRARRVRRRAAAAERALERRALERRGCRGRRRTGRARRRRAAAGALLLGGGRQEVARRVARAQLDQLLLLGVRARVRVRVRVRGFELDAWLLALLRLIGELG